MLREAETGRTQRGSVPAWRNTGPCRHAEPGDAVLAPHQVRAWCYHQTTSTDSTVFMLHLVSIRGAGIPSYRFSLRAETSWRGIYSSVMVSRTGGATGSQ
ncbi:hypothetical protein RRG08_064469 [Elysia crispata]|uniref:Uncharacterized protein n=1 Tax=Elysia crispata TaxID=231223 RepID=A0AAE1DXR3_9GAST|nr:hypothetical protein RRG08_064469 [Elysia crispata]